jgi:DNA invertase Pin-like site-specific DNA recombinase
MSGRLIGYARVSTDEQTHDPQVRELKTAKCDEIVLEYGSGADRERPKLAELLRRLAAGEPWWSGFSRKAANQRESRPSR